MTQTTDELFLPEICSKISHAIASNKGGEVFFVAFTNNQGFVCAAEAVAFGSEDSVPAPLADGMKGDLVIHNHPSGDLRASTPDVNIAALLATHKLGFYIINNDCTEVNVVYKPKPKVHLGAKEILGIFQKNGILAEMIGAYEERPEQEQMVSSIIQAVNGGEILLAEAGTGTGKSFAYLIPAALWAVQSDKRVIVTTHTINLQNQIAKKDAQLVASLVERLTGKRPLFSVLVGRSNYICPKMVEELLEDPAKTRSLFDNEESTAHTLDMISQWIPRAAEGLRGELPDTVSAELWEEINATTPSCQRKECPLYDKCFYYKARMAAEAAHVIIGNHALLLAAIDEEQGFLSTIPQFSGLVMDEAHHLETVALRAMAETFSFGSIAWRLSRLYRRRGIREMGQLALLPAVAALPTVPKAEELYHEAIDSITAFKDFLNDKEQEFRSLLGNTPPTLELSPALLISPLWIDLKGILSDIFAKVRSLEITLTELEKALGEHFPNIEKIKDVLRVIALHVGALAEMRLCHDHLFGITPDETLVVKQLEITQRQVRFSAGPAEMGDFLAKHLFRPKEFVIFTSATLSVNGNFDFFNQGVGLSYVQNEKNINQISLPSPFNYAQQMEMLVLKEEGLLPHRALQERYHLLEDAVCLTGGGALILFTSYRAMDEAFAALKDAFLEAGLHPISQRERSREELLETIKEKDYAVLFATSSFWEGIDVPGEHLRFLVIDKLPFENPEDPLLKAKSKIIEEKGGNAFMEYSVPLAVLRFKQGIGRLIRSKSDRGMLLVLDGRIYSKRYGKAFLDTARPAPSYYLSHQEILSRIKYFFKI